MSCFSWLAMLFGVMPPVPPPAPWDDSDDETYDWARDGMPTPRQRVIQELTRLLLNQWQDQNLQEELLTLQNIIREAQGLPPLLQPVTPQLKKLAMLQLQHAMHRQVLGNYQNPQRQSQLMLEELKSMLQLQHLVLPQQPRLTGSSRDDMPTPSQCAVQELTRQNQLLSQDLHLQENTLTLQIDMRQVLDLPPLPQKLRHRWFLVMMQLLLALEEEDDNNDVA